MSSAITQSTLLSHEVYLIEYVLRAMFFCKHRARSDSTASRLDNAGREKMRHLRCLCFVRPSSDAIQLLIDELRSPKYGEYSICTFYPRPSLCAEPHIEANDGGESKLTRL